MTRTNLKTKHNDNVFVDASIVSLEELTCKPTTSSKSQAIISEGQIVNVVSDKYGFLPNEKFYLAVEEKLINSDIKYTTSSINKGNKSFKVDYILDENYATNIGNAKDIIVPLMSFTNSYDGSGKTAGTFGLFRQVCSNGLMVADTQIGFSYKHTANHLDIVMPEIDRLIVEFTKTEYFELQQKFQHLSDNKINDIQAFVEEVCKQTKIFQYGKMVEGEEVISKKAVEVMSIIEREANQLKVYPNMWLGYNAFNEVIHNMNSRNFEVQNQKDHKIFESILSLS
jgi:hypothetical protein